MHRSFISTASDSIPLSMHDLTPPLLNNREIKNMTPQQVTADSFQWAVEGRIKRPVSQEQGEIIYTSAILKKTQMPNKRHSLKP